MYEAFFGLSSKPFQLNPDPKFYYSSKPHRRARSYLVYGVMRGEGFIVITGEVGAGKTTIGRQLADLLRWEFVDSDHEIEARTGADIPWIFDIEGEAGFRLREEQVIDALTQRRHIVLATGGGAVTREQNRRHLHDRGTVIYLETPVERQLERTVDGAERVVAPQRVAHRQPAGQGAVGGGQVSPRLLQRAEAQFKVPAALIAGIGGVAGLLPTGAFAAADHAPFQFCHDVPLI